MNCDTIDNCTAVTCTTNANETCATCASGYEPNGSGGCRNIDDCTAGICGTGTCIDGVNDYTCTCLAGQWDNNTTCVNCDTIDNCTAVTCTTNANETCATCASGYEPNGSGGCRNIDDCTAGICGTGTCVDGVNDYTCTCLPGQWDNNTTCVGCGMVDNCDVVECSPLGVASCVDCKDGFESNGAGGCRAIGGCTPNPCGDGTCAEVGGGYQCDCPVGQYDDGTTCVLCDCDDGAFCNGVEICDPNEGCKPGVAPHDDGIACTVDTCNEELDQIDNSSSDLFCQNRLGLYCDGAETCNPTSGAADSDGCVAGMPVTCADDNNACTDDECNEATNGCGIAKADNVQIPDGNTCNGVEFCLGGQPQPGTNLGMGDACGDATTTLCDAADTCDGSGVCLTNHVQDGPADDGNPCNGNESCLGGEVVAGTPMAEGEVCGRSPGQCDAGQICTSGACVDGGFLGIATPCDGTSQEGGCDDDENDRCSGTDNNCVDAFREVTWACDGTSTGAECDADFADHCSGDSAVCEDGFHEAGAICGEVPGECEVSDGCSGTSAVCLGLRFKPEDAPCGEGTPSDPTCDAADSCNATGTCLTNTAADGTVFPAVAACLGYAGRCSNGQLACNGDNCAFPFDVGTTPWQFTDGDLTGMGNDFSPVDDMCPLLDGTLSPDGWDGGPDQVFSFIASDTGIHIVAVNDDDSPVDVSWMLYGDGECADATCIGVSEADPTNEDQFVNLIAGQQYFLVVDTYDPDYAGSYLVSVTLCEACGVDECGDGQVTGAELCESPSDPRCTECMSCANGYDTNVNDICRYCGDGELTNGEACETGTNCNVATCQCSGEYAAIAGVCGTCTDGIKNGPETGIDCGGACATCVRVLWCFDDTSSTTGGTSGTLVATLSAGVTSVSGVSRGPSLLAVSGATFAAGASGEPTECTGTGSNRAITAQNWSTASALTDFENGRYVEFTVTHGAGAFQILFHDQVSGTGPTKWAVWSSLTNGIVAEGNTHTGFVSARNVANFGTLAAAADHKIRIYGFAAGAAGGTMRVDNLELKTP